MQYHVSSIGKKRVYNRDRNFTGEGLNVYYIDILMATIMFRRIINSKSGLIPVEEQLLFNWKVDVLNDEKNTQKPVLGQYDQNCFPKRDPSPKVGQ